MNSEWKEIIEQEMEREAESIMEEVNSDPALKDVQAPPDLYDGLMKKIREYEKQKVYDQLSEEDKEYLRVGKAYMKRRRLNRYIVLVAAVVFVLAFGTVSMGENKNIFHLISMLISMLISGEERTTVDSGETDLITYLDEYKVYGKIEEEYGFSPVKLGYLPDNIGFHEATFGTELQGVNLFYMTGDEVNIVYIIRPNYRESSFATVIEDEKIQEYTIDTSNVLVKVTEYKIVESGENRWAVGFEYQNVQYLLRITDMEQEEVEKIVNDLCFIE